MERYPLPPTPDGWYRVAISRELEVGDVAPLHYFGRDLVLFRGEDGAARLFDAHCPHLGAHLGHGGHVRGDGIQCPFHGWRFDGGGRCVSVPRLDHPPPAAQLRRYPVRECNGLIMAFYDSRGEEPDWEIPDYRTGGSKEWTEWSASRFEIRTHIQELGENILDRPHFHCVHDMDDPEDVRFEARFEGPRMTVEQNLLMTGTASAGVSVFSRTVNSGPGVSLTSVRFGQMETLTLLTQTPVGVEKLDLRLDFCMKKTADASTLEAVAKLNQEIVKSQFEQDIRIWENKIYRERPLLTAVDGPIPEYRRWYRQFYSDWVDSPEAKKRTSDPA